jgi:hypothetical protein
VGRREKKVSARVYKQIKKQFLFCFDCSQLKQATNSFPAARDLANCRTFSKRSPLVVGAAAQNITAG